MQLDDSVSFDVGSARLVTAGRVYADASWMMANHCHAYWEFIYFLRGSGQVDVPTGLLRPQRYHIVVYPPGLPHAEKANPSDPEETVFFGVSMPGAPPAGAHLLIPDPQGEMRWLCERIVGECQAHGITPLAESYTHAFLYLLDRAWGSGIPVQHDAVDVAVQFLHENYSRQIALRSIAEFAHVSETHLSHRFSERMGVSPLRYLQRVRLENSKRLLSTTELPVCEIAQAVGYDDPLYFSRVFRRATGLSPSSFRSARNSATESMLDAIESISDIGSSDV